jgi:hypothetical protein
MVALASDLNFFGSRFFTRLTAVFFIRLGHAFAGKVGTFVVLTRRHYCSPCIKSGPKLMSLIGQSNWFLRVFSGAVGDWPASQVAAHSRVSNF